MNVLEKKSKMEEEITQLEYELKSLANNRNVLLKELDIIEDKIIGNKELLRKSKDELYVFVNRKFPDTSIEDARIRDIEDFKIRLKDIK